MALFPLILVLVSTFMHAGWNLLARRQRGRDIFLPTQLFIAAAGLGPVLLAEWLGDPILPIAWRYLFWTGLFQALYFLGLLQGYRNGDFSVVYPVARALPVLVLALADVWRGRPPSLWGWLGVLLVSAGCLLVPLHSWRDFAWVRYRNATTAWVLLAATGTVGYTLIDKQAAELMRPGWNTAVRYGIFEFSTTFFFYWLTLKVVRYPTGQVLERAVWLRAGLAGVFMFGAYSLVLWAYQLATHISYVVALRQFSIVLGVVAAAIWFNEPAPGWRISMALMIVLGVAMISAAG